MYILLGYVRFITGCLPGAKQSPKNLMAKLIIHAGAHAKGAQCTWQ